MAIDASLFSEEHFAVAAEFTPAQLTGIAANPVYALENEGDMAHIDVREYGALGDGRTDDTAAIQSALRACGAAGGGTVYLASGHYRITSPLALSGQTLVCGAGRKNSVIWANNCSGIVWDGGDGTSGKIFNAACHSTLRDLTIQGDYSANHDGVVLSHISDWAIEDVTICDFARYGLDLYWVVTMGLLNVVIRDCNSHGVRIRDSTTITFGPGCHSKNHNGWGIYAEGNSGAAGEQTQVTDLRLTGTTVEGNAEGGLYAYQYVSMLSLDGCHFENNTQNNTTTQTGQTRPAVSPARTIGRSVYLGNLAGTTATAIQGATISGCRFSNIATLGTGYHIDSERVNGLLVDGNAFYGATKSLYYSPASSVNVRFGLTNFENADVARPNKNYLAGSSTFSGTTGRTINLDWRSSGGTLYKVAILPTAAMVGRWYVAKAGSSFTVYSTDVGDTGAFDWLILQEGA